jgi:hypothetical protein
MLDEALSRELFAALQAAQPHVQVGQRLAEQPISANAWPEFSSERPMASRRLSNSCGVGMF